MLNEQLLAAYFCNMSAVQNSLLAVKSDGAKDPHEVGLVFGPFSSADARILRRIIIQSQLKRYSP